MDELQIIKEKRKNIFLMFFFSLFIVITAYYLINSVANKVISSIEEARQEYRPVVTNLNASAGEAGAGVREIAQSGKAVIEKFPTMMTESIDTAKKEYNTSQVQIVTEYNNIKSNVETDYQVLKKELASLKADLRKDVDWVKQELAQWRTLLGYITFAFGLIITLTSIKDILENTRWFISFISGFFKHKENKTLSNSND